MPIDQLDTAPYYTVYAGRYGDLHWVYTAWIPCGHSLVDAIRRLADLQQLPVDFAGILVSFAS